jgi:cell division protein FtsL
MPAPVARSITVNSALNTLSLDAVPEVHELVASIIQKFDIPKRTVEFQFFLVKGSDQSDTAFRLDFIQKQIEFYEVNRTVENRNLENEIDALNTQKGRYAIGVTSLSELRTAQNAVATQQVKIDKLDMEISARRRELAAFNENLKENGLPEKVLAALNELAGLTRFKIFELLDAPILTAREGTGAKLSGVATDDIPFYELGIEGLIVSGEASERRIRIDPFTASLSVVTSTPTPGFARTLALSTALEFAEGEMTVIGTQQVPGRGASNQAIIVIVTAKIL